MNWENLLCDQRIRSHGKSKSSSDLRSEFEKDYHRIIGSASFRRLQDKTQVFPLDKSDFIRTRLTHSMEVSSLAKSLGQNVAARIIREIQDSSFRPEYQGAVCDILQCAGLLHDIGNPPFGHFGEDAIRDWFTKNLPKLAFHADDVKVESLIELLDPQMVQDFYHFEGNTQAFRLVTKLHYLVDEHGMNLTKALLGTIVKYPVSSLEIDKRSGDLKTKKMGYYYADAENFLAVQDALGTHGSRHPLTYLLEAADDIAYKTADIEDAFKKGCIGYEALLRELRDFVREKVAESKKQELGDSCIVDDWEKEYNLLVGKLTGLYDRAIRDSQKNPEEYAIQNWIVQVQGRMIYCATDCFVKNYQGIMGGSYKSDLFEDSFAKWIMGALGDIAYRYVFISNPILKLEIAAETIFTFLLDRFVKAILYYDTDKECEQSAVDKKLVMLISDNYKSIYHHYAKGASTGEKLYLRLLLVTDFVCGMTDSYAKDLYQQFNGIQ